MKKQVLSTLFVAGVLLCGSPVSASHESSIVARHARVLEGLASEMEDQFREDLQHMHKHYPPSRVERQFLASLCQLAGIVRQFHLAAEQCAPACELERGFEAVEQAFECAEESSDEVNVCSCLQGMMSRFEDTLECIEDVGFETVSRQEPDYSPHHHHHGGVNTGGIQFRVPLPQGLPFVFRQPMGIR